MPDAPSRQAPTGPWLLKQAASLGHQGVGAVVPTGLLRLGVSIFNLYCIEGRFDERLPLQFGQSEIDIKEAAQIALGIKTRAIEGSDCLGQLGAMDRQREYDPL